MKRLSAFIILLLAMAVLAVAQPAPSPCVNSELMKQRGKDQAKLNLSDEQQKTIKELRLQHRKDLIPLRSAVELKELDLHSEMMVEKPNMARIYALVDELAKARAEIEKKQIALRFKIREQLTPEQRKIWDEKKGWGGDGMPAGAFGGRRMGNKPGFERMHGPGPGPGGMEAPVPDMED
jgi:Spy/CpxP family protein refolding chaperone